MIYPLHSFIRLLNPQLFVMLPMSHKIRSKTVANTKLSLSSNVYDSLHDMHPYDAHLMGVTNDTQKYINVSKNI